jgi:hypothetical protein
MRANAGPSDVRAVAAHAGQAVSEGLNCAISLLKDSADTRRYYLPTISNRTSTLPRVA